MAPEGGGEELLVGRTLHVVVDAIAPLVRDDLLLARHLRVAQDQVGHAVRLEPHHQRQLAAREVVVIERPVGPGRRVRLATRGLEQAIELARRHARGLVEHQVLEEVRQARLAGLLVARADTKPRLIAHDGRRAIDQEEDHEPVAETVTAHHQRCAEGDLLDEGEASVALAHAAIELPHEGLALEGR